GFAACGNKPSRASLGPGRPFPDGLSGRRNKYPWDRDSEHTTSAADGFFGLRYIPRRLIAGDGSCKRGNHCPPGSSDTGGRGRIECIAALVGTQSPSPTAHLAGADLPHT